MKMRPLGVAVSLVVVGCYSQTWEEAEDVPGSRQSEINLSTCGTVPCLPPPTNCSGPDSSGWSNQPRPADAGACPAAPSPAGCTQYVLGRMTDVAKYINCPGYVVLNRSDYTRDMNNLFISCAACGNSSPCSPPILIASANGSIPDQSSTSPWTSTELCQLNKYCTVSPSATGTGSVTGCNCTALPKDCDGGTDGGTDGGSDGGSDGGTDGGSDGGSDGGY